MSDFFHDRAAEIIAAYGGDPGRWPEAERDTALTVIAADPALTAARETASDLDRDLLLWARTPVAAGDAAAAATAAMRPLGGVGRWVAGGGAAAAAALMLLALPHTVPVTTTVARTATVTDAQAFTALFTPTPDEENLI